jgi:hypothetical protein
VTEVQTVSLCILVGAFFAADYGGFAVAALVRVRRTTRPGDVRRDLRRSSRGEPFEAVWQGSRGYEPPPPRPSGNLTDRLVIVTATPLRPSRFQDRSYWRAYLPAVGGIMVAGLIGLPLVAVALISSPAATFRPTARQQSAIVRGAVVEPPLCSGGAASGPVTSIDYTAEGTVLTVHPGTRLAVTYYPGLRPAFSPGVPLCRAAPEGRTQRSQTLDYGVTRLGTGYLYFPQFDHSAFVVRIDAVGAAGPPVALLVIAAAILIADVVLRFRLRGYGQ